MFPKPLMSIVVAGHVDHGKSTLIGRLLLDTNSLAKEKLAEIKKISRELGKETELAYLSDQLKEERECSMTIDTTQIFFKTRKRNYCIIDAPGHEKLIKNMITGASIAQTAVLIVDVAEGIKEQSRRHAYIIGMLGINKVIVIFNKMDLVGYKKEKFEEVKNGLLRFLDNLKLKPLFLIPASAKDGANISNKSSQMSWYKGPYFLQALDLIKPGARNVRRPLRFAVQDTYEIGGEKIAVGKLLSGVIKQGQNVTILPAQEEAKINSIKIFQGVAKKAGAGENIGLILDKPVKRGQIITQKDMPPRITHRFKANIFWLSEDPLKIDARFTLRCSTQDVNCAIEKIEKRIDSSTLDIIDENAKELNLNEIAVAILKTEQPIVIENFDFIEELGRFVIEQENNSKAAGIITQLEN